jgi:hypothetical protein
LASNRWRGLSQRLKHRDHQRIKSIGDPDLIRTSDLQIRNLVHVLSRPHSRFGCRTQPIEIIGCKFPRFAKLLSKFKADTGLLISWSLVRLLHHSPNHRHKTSPRVIVSHSNDAKVALVKICSMEFVRGATSAVGCTRLSRRCVSRPALVMVCSPVDNVAVHAAFSLGMRNYR